MIDGIARQLDSRLGSTAFPCKDSGDLSKASHRLATLAEKALNESPEYIAALRDLIACGVQGAACDIIQARAHKEQAAEQARKGNFKLAACLLTKALAFTHERQHRKEASTCLINRAICLLQLELHKHAAEDCLAALELRSSIAKAHFLRALALKELQQYSEGIQHAHAAAPAADAEKLPASASHDAARLLANMQALAGSSVAGAKAPAVPIQSATESCVSVPALEVRDTASEGRALCMGSQESANAGALLMQEGACVSAVTKQHRKAVRPLHTPVKTTPWTHGAAHYDLDAWYEATNVSSMAPALQAHLLQRPAAVESH